MIDSLFLACAADSESSTLETSGQATGVPSEILGTQALDQRRVKSSNDYHKKSWGSRLP
jgi:hypothetical protein